MKEIPLSKGYSALVDDEDYERVSKFKWCACVDLRKDKTVRTVYGSRNVTVNIGKKRQRTLMLHRFIMGVTDTSLNVDHIDGDGLNCQRSNMRLATRAQNLVNYRNRINNTSGYRGVCWNKSCNAWQAQVNTQKKYKYLGLFSDPKEAALAVDSANKEYHGEFARMNFPNIEVKS